QERARPPCAITGTRLPAGECRLLARLSADGAAQAQALTAARRRLLLVDETVRATFEPRFFCVGAGDPRAGECFRSIVECVDARAVAAPCRHQDEAYCFTADGATHCAASLDACAALATTDGLGAEARASCHRTYLGPPSPPALAPPAAPPAAVIASSRQRA
ncbi:MAG TPA: hypothetical protein VHE35_16480, partial [Kofleriaceae bacterium]|nr:hypothetical protein [Kofleriaceae bacterium]